MYYTKQLKVLLCFFSMFVSFMGNAANSLVIKVNNAEKSEVVFALKELPQYWVEGNMLKLQSSTTSAEFPLSSVVKAYFGDVLTDVVETSSAEVYCFPNPTTEGVYISHVTDAEMISLTDATGKVLPFSVTNVSDYYYLDLSALPTGIYYLNINRQTFKILKK
jgi:hypothetical protein